MDITAIDTEELRLYLMDSLRLTTYIDYGYYDSPTSLVIRLMLDGEVIDETSVDLPLA